MANNDKDRVKFWLPYIRETRTDMGLTEKKYPDELVLAVIGEATEPKGDPMSHREGSDAYGLFGAGRRQVTALGHPDAQKESAKFLQGKGKPAVRNFLRYVELYAREAKNKPHAGHDYDPELIALTWYTGPDAVEAFKKDRDGKLDGLKNTFVGTRINSNLETSFVEAAGLKLKEGFQTDFGLDGDKTFGLTPQSRVLGTKRRASSAALTLDIPSLDTFAEAYASWATGDADVAPAARGRTPSGKFARNVSVSLPPGCKESEIGETSARAPLPGTEDTPEDTPELRTSARAPLPGVKEQNIDVDRLAKGAENAKAVLGYIDSNYTKDLKKFLHTTQSHEATRAYWTAEDTQRVRGFVDDAKNGDAAFTFQTALLKVATTFVKPLVGAFPRNAWGQSRGYAAGPRDENKKRIRLVDPVTGKRLHRYHLGIDYETRTSSGGLGRYQPCYAIAAGKVVRTRNSPSYGKVIYIDHGGGVSSRYAHLDKFLVSRGDSVEKGQVIAHCGHSEGTGSKEEGTYKFETRKDTHFTPHMHFEIRFNIGFLQTGEMLGTVLNSKYNVSVDPEPLLAGAPDPGEVVEETDPVIANLKAARDSFAHMAVQAETPAEAEVAANNSDNTAAYLRGEELSTLTRYDFLRAQAQNSYAQTRAIAGSSLPTGN